MIPYSAVQIAKDVAWLSRVPMWSARSAGLRRNKLATAAHRPQSNEVHDQMTRSRPGGVDKMFSPMLM